MSGIPYLGCKLSLVSKSEIRYEGILYTIDTKESTVALAKVKSFGTENRPTDRPIAARDEVYEYIIFRASDIKDLHVCEPPKQSVVPTSGLPSDPAIVQHSAPVGSSGPFSAQPSHGHVCLSQIPHFPSQIPYVQPSVFSLGHVTGSRGAVPSSQNSKCLTTDASVQVSVPEIGNKERQSEGQNLRLKNDQRIHIFPPRNFPANRRQPLRGRGPRRGRGGRGGSLRVSNVLKFDKEYDFELANEEFTELVKKTNKIDENVPEDCSDIVIDDESYDKEKSFFDNISCEDSRISKGIPRFDWRIERKLNVETFGVQTGSNPWFRRRRGRNVRRGARGGRDSVAEKRTEPGKNVTFSVSKLATLEEERDIAPEERKVEEIPTIEIVEDKEKAFE